MKTDETLMPCPFCGGEDIVVVDNSDPNTGEQDWLICCGNCGSAFIASNDAMPVTRGELIERWNSRTRVKRPEKSGVWYWPMAITENGEKLFTYDSVFTVEKALEQFSIWADHYDYKIKEAWIERTDGKRIEVERRWMEVKEDAETE